MAGDEAKPPKATPKPAPTKPRPAPSAGETPWGEYVEPRRMKEAINNTGVNNLAYVDALYARYQRDKQSMPEAWRDYFADLHNEADGRAKSGPSFRARSLFNPGPVQAAHRPAPAPDQL